MVMNMAYLDDSGFRNEDSELQISMRQSSDFQPKPIKRKNQAKINPCLSVQVSPLRDSGVSGQDIALSLSPAQRQRPRAERNNMSLDLNKNRVSARSFAIEDNFQ